MADGVDRTEDVRLDGPALEALGEEIAGFAARIDMAEHALLHKLRVFDEHEAWHALGFRSCALWLSWRIHIGLTAAREKVRVARALATLPKVRAITRVATPDNERDFIDVATHARAAQLARMTRCYERCAAMKTDTGLPPANERRYVRRGDSLGGMVKIEIELPPSVNFPRWDGSPLDLGDAMTWLLHRERLDRASAEQARTLDGCRRDDLSVDARPAGLDP